MSSGFYVRSLETVLRKQCRGRRALKFVPSPMEESEYVDSAAGNDGNNIGQVSSYIDATGLSSPGPSHRDPQQNTSFSSSQQSHPLHDAAAFDRFYSLVEVCAAAGSPLTPLNSPSQPSPIIISHPPVPPLSPTGMVSAPPSDVEEDPASSTSFLYKDSIAKPRRRHACKLCDKAFDRPSTLKTHLLVHTGVTPFACHLCGRRFGVQSNCNRHIKRCTLRSELFLARRLEFQSSQNGYSRSSTSHNLNDSPPPRPGPRSSSPPAPPKPKRARRKRSPTAAWIPQSLASFKLPSTHAPAPVPLPPVRPRTAQEERDSYIACHDQPYTEEGWSGILPGPAPLYDSMTKTFSDLVTRSSSKR